MDSDDSEKKFFDKLIPSLVAGIIVAIVTSITNKFTFIGLVFILLIVVFLLLCFKYRNNKKRNYSILFGCFTFILILVFIVGVFETSWILLSNEPVEISKTTENSLSQQKAPQTNLLSNVTIDYPPDNFIVNNRTNISGTVENIPNGYTLWICVYSYENKNSNQISKYYPLGNPPIHRDKWNLENREIGDNNDCDNKFDIIGVNANAQANEEFLRYINNSKNSNTSEGMTELPNGSSIKATITVTRKTDLANQTLNYNISTWLNNAFYRVISFTKLPLADSFVKL